MRKWFCRGFFIGMSVAAVSLLSGCAAIEPEERAFPLIIGVDYQEEQFRVMYGMPNMALVTGQEKADVNGAEEEQVIMYTGSTPKEARKRFDLSQEKYLDLGHVEVLVLGNGIINEQEKMEELLAYLEGIPSVAGNLYVFTTDQLYELMALNGREIDSLGEYLTGIVENKPDSVEKEIPQLYDLYNAWHNQEKYPKLINIGVEGRVVFLE